MYPSFVEGMTLDRVDNDRGYSPDNCRWVTNNIQRRNTRILKSTNTSGYRGVSWHKQSKKWRATITVDNKHIHIGSFGTAIDAAEAYNEFIILNSLEHTINDLKER